MKLYTLYMKLKTWVAQEKGRGVALADHLSVTKGAVWQATRSHSGVPVSWHRSVYDFTGGEVSYLEMLSDADRKEAVRRAPFITIEIKLSGKAVKA
jgi:hypothetical protein